MRVYVIWFMFIFFAYYAWKDWYRVACFLVFSMAIIEVPWMPKEVLGIPGMNPWNLVFISTVIASMVNPARDVPKLTSGMRRLIVFYSLVVLLAFIRELVDRDQLVQLALAYGQEPVSTQALVQEDLLNTFKYVVPALLIYRGCNSTARFKEAVVAILAMNLLLAILTLKSMGLDGLTSGSNLSDVAIRRIDRDVGYYRSDLAILLAGGAWGLFVFRDLLGQAIARFGALISSGLCAAAIGFSGGRMGMAAYAVVGMMLAAYRSRVLFVIGPLLLAISLAFFPAVQERFTQGFSYDEDDVHNSYVTDDGDVNLASVTSNRVVVWPHVIDEIAEHPFLGQGRRTMTRKGLTGFLGEMYRLPLKHPHNAYLELFLDNGFLLGLPVLAFFIAVLRLSYRQFRDNSNQIRKFAGTFSIIYIMSFLLGSIAQQSFYPFAGSVGMWVAIALALRQFANDMSNTGTTALA